jgi:DNA-directed RNA polymerase subunit beta'
VQVGSEVVAGQVLADGPLNLHARLFVLGKRSTLTALVGAVSDLLDRSMELADLEKLLLPVVHGFVRVVQPGQTSFAPGEVSSAERFDMENERVLAAGKTPAIAEAVFVGLSE